MDREKLFLDNKQALIAICTKALFDSFEIIINAARFGEYQELVQEAKRRELKRLDTERIEFFKEHPEAIFPFGSKPENVEQKFESIQKRYEDALLLFALARLKITPSPLLMYERFDESKEDYWKIVAMTLIHEHLLTKQQSIGAPRKNFDREISCAKAFDAMKNYCLIFQGLEKSPYSLSKDLKFTTSFFLKVYKAIHVAHKTDHAITALKAIEQVMKLKRAEENVANNVVSKGRRVLRQNFRTSLVKSYDQIIRSKPYYEFTINDFIYNEKEIS